MELWGFEGHSGAVVGERLGTYKVTIGDLIRRQGLQQQLAQKPGPLLPHQEAKKTNTFVRGRLNDKLNRLKDGSHSNTQKRHQTSEKDSDSSGHVRRYVPNPAADHDAEGTARSPLRGT